VTTATISAQWVSRNGDEVREALVDDFRRKVVELADRGLGVAEVETSINGHGELTETEQDILFILATHAVREAESRP
jgi:hypothetical protein